MTHDTRSIWRERLASPLTWHYLAFALLLVAAILLAVRVGFDWVAVDRHAEQAAASRQVELAALEAQTAPLRGLDKKVAATRDAMDSFYKKRIPPNYSSIAGRIDELAVKSGVRLSRIQYTHGAAGAYLTEISLDSGISGSYPEIMRFINSIERDPEFFVIRAMALTGQSGGLVNLRLRVSTWLRPADADASGLPAADSDSADSSTKTPARPEVK
jgi:Tfp pilus assembly protein PilO